MRRAKRGVGLVDKGRNATGGRLVDPGEQCSHVVGKKPRRVDGKSSLTIQTRGRVSVEEKKK